MSRSKELAKERLKPARELYSQGKELLARPGANQHLLYKSTLGRVAPPPPTLYPGKWSANG